MSVTNPGVEFKVTTGYLNATIIETVNSEPFFNKTGSVWTTITFDVSGTTAPRQGKYIFAVFNNQTGTLNLRFIGPQPLTVTHSASSEIYSNTKQWEELNYTVASAQTSTLVLVYAGATQARSSFTLAAVVLFGFLTLFFPLTFMKWLIEGQMGQGEPIVSMLKNRRRFVILLIAVTIVGIVGVITVLLEPILG